MSCTIVVGGQYGSEGKGKVTALLVSMHEEPWVVRCGGPNSGHTVSIRGREVVLRQVPAGADCPGALLLLSAGCAVDEEVLLNEVHGLGLEPERIVVDPRAVLIQDEDRERERSLRGRIGSTCSGTGAALIRRMGRSAEVRLVADSQKLQDRVRVAGVAPLVHSHLDCDGHVIVEGTQGFGLSLLHGTSYPYETARDTTAAAFAMEVGLSPRQVDDVVMVIRTFPIRVGGNSGPLADETTWEEVQSLSGAPRPFPEYTSVTKRLRRVGGFDIESVKKACLYNRPTALAVMGLDRLDHRNSGLRNFSRLTDQALAFVRMVESETGVPVTLVGTGFTTAEAIWVPAPKAVRQHTH